MKIEKERINRRSFIKGAVLSSGAVVGGSLLTGLLGGCAEQTTNPEQTSPQEINQGEVKKYSWETPPEPIPDSQIKD